MVVEYEGTDYHGFAIQRRQRTVQGELERAVAQVTGVRTRVVGSGRTDAGAHALAQVVSFGTETRLSSLELRRALNANLPSDLIVKQVEEAPESFDARRSAMRRHYRYSVWNAKLPSVWQRRYRYHIVDRLDVEAMDRAARLLVGAHDYACFVQGLCRYLASGAKRTTVRTLFEAGWSGAAPELDFDVTGTAFMPHMIRNMVGAMLRVGTGKWTVEQFSELVQDKGSRLSMFTVPAHGLALVAVDY